MGEEFLHGSCCYANAALVLWEKGRGIVSSASCCSTVATRPSFLGSAHLNKHTLGASEGHLTLTQCDEDSD